MLPKWSLDPNSHEVGRAIRYLQDSSVDIIALRLPNRTGMFQEDLYPPFESKESSNDFATWASGTDNPVKTMQIRPGTETADTTD
jgi:hypothetical protein